MFFFSYIKLVKVELVYTFFLFLLGWRVVVLSDKSSLSFRFTLSWYSYLFIYSFMIVDASKSCQIREQMLSRSRCSSST